MRQIEKLLPAEGFCRVHRSYIVGIASIQSFDKERIYMEDPDDPHRRPLSQCTAPQQPWSAARTAIPMMMDEEDAMILADEED